MQFMPSFCARASKGFAQREAVAKKNTGTWTAVKRMNPCLQDWNAVKPWLLNTDPSIDPIKSIKALSTIKIETTGFFFTKKSMLGKHDGIREKVWEVSFQVEIRKCSSLGILVFLCFFFQESHWGLRSTGWFQNPHPLPATSPGVSVPFNGSAFLVTDDQACSASTSSFWNEQIPTQIGPWKNPERMWNPNIKCIHTYVYV